MSQSAHHTSSFLSLTLASIAAASFAPALSPSLAAQGTVAASRTAAAPAPESVAAQELPVVGAVKPFHRVLQGPSNPLGIAVPVAETIVFDTGAWLQMGFADAVLVGGSFVEITSLVDGDTQRLTEADFAGGVGQSAYFNGNAVRLRLWAGSMAPAPSLRIADLAVGHGAWLPPATICGTADNRVLGARAASARLIIKKGTSTYICSGWLVSTKNGFATAGHCLSGTISALTAQFNVPNSTSSGSMVNPPASSQYSWISSSRRYVDGGAGNDYGVFRTNQSAGLWPYQRQGSRFTTGAPAVGTTYTRHGFGSASGTRNFAAKYHSGACSSISSYRIYFNTLDSTGGDSGSVYYRGTVAYGVHTHGGCTATGGANSGTSVRHPTFASYISSVQN
ncbi:MAG: hypothetical protein R3F56_25850 [Planctomycetota bacterium]